MRLSRAARSLTMCAGKRAGADMGSHAQLCRRTTDDPLQEKANQVTLALRKTTELMRAELDSSVMASQLLGALVCGYWFLLVRALTLHDGPCRRIDPDYQVDQLTLRQVLVLARSVVASDPRARADKLLGPHLHPRRRRLLPLHVRVDPQASRL
jgi:hypothetical protein